MESRCHLGLALVLVIAAFGIAACGGGESPEVDYSTFAACVKADPVVVVEEGSDTVDVIAGGAGEGALQLHWGETQFANVAVERSEEDAQDTEEQYGDGFGDLSHIERSGNVVIAYANEPSEDEAALVSECIEDGGQ